MTNSLKAKIPSLGSLFVEIIPLSHSQLISCIDLKNGFLILFDGYPKPNGPTNPTSKKNSNRPLEHTQDRLFLPVSEGNLSIFVFWGVCSQLTNSQLGSLPDLVLVGIFNGAGILDLLFHCLPVSHILGMSFKLKVKKPGGTKSSGDEGTYCRTMQGPTCMEW